MKIGAVVQARMSSKRFPGKVLHRILGKPMLEYLFESLKHCRVLDEMIVATSGEATDDAIRIFCEKYDIHCYRGSLGDVAGRFNGIIDTFKYDGFVRISGDSPLLDYRLVSKAVEIFKTGGYDIVTNVQKRTFPKGQSVEVIRSSTFNTVYPLMTNTLQKEHVTSYFYQNKSQFSIYNFESRKDYGNIQLSIDTKDDMNLIEKLVGSMSKPHWDYTFEELVRQLPRF